MLEYKERNNQSEAKQKRKSSDEKDETISTKKSTNSDAAVKKKACATMHWNENKETINQKQNKKGKLVMIKIKQLAQKNQQVSMLVRNRKQLVKSNLQVPEMP